MDPTGLLKDSVMWTVDVTSTCACDCSADPVCDQVISNVQDVVVAINVAFRGIDPPVDPNAFCPFATSDVDCSSATDIVDVVHIVNVAFRSANPGLEFCIPCP
jgi:hypothetical protein